MGASSSGPRPSLGRNLAAIVGAVLVVNGLLFGLGWVDGGGRGGPDAGRASALDPPGWLVGTVWTALLAMLAVARWKLGGPSGAAERRWVTGLILSCLAYPFYAIAPGNMLAAFLGNLGTIALAAFVAWRVWPKSRAASACVMPVVPWVVFATFTILDDWGWFARAA